MLKYRTEKVVDSFDLDRLVQDTYGKGFCYQQQDGCKSKGSEVWDIPTKFSGVHLDVKPEDVKNTTYGTTFKTWLESDLYEHFPNKEVGLKYERNFYPPLGDVLNDLHSKGLIEEGRYRIVIDW